MPDPFGGFGWICRHTVLPQCNLFFNQLWNEDSSFLEILFPSGSESHSNYSVTGQSARDDSNVRTAQLDAGTGVGANCVIPHVGHRGSVGDIALMVVAVLSTILVLLLTFFAGRRKAAVGRVELRLLLTAYAAHCALSVITMSSVLEQGTTALAVLSAVHVAVVVTFFWILLGNALIATQVFEDGTPAALVPLIVIAVLFFVPALYISLDTALRWTDTFRFLGENNVENLRSIALFILTLLWPALAALLYLIIMMYVVLIKLRERKPAVIYFAAGLSFAAAQVIFFLVSQPLCDASNGKVNSAFLSILLNTAAVGLMYWAWKVITEETWGEDEYGYYQ